MRLCFFSDIHGNGSALDALLLELDAQNPELMVFGGDFAGYYYDTDEVITRIREKGIRCILGNHDRMLLEALDGKRDPESLKQKYGSSYERAMTGVSRENLEFLRTLTPSCTLETDGLRLGFFHGSPRDALEDRIYPDTQLDEEKDFPLFQEYDYVFCGHTHHKLVRAIGGCILINPGSAGQPRDGKGTSYVVFDTSAAAYEIRAFDYDKQAIARQIERYEKESPLMGERLKEAIFRKKQ